MPLRGVRALLLDFDDTLVRSSEADAGALRAVLGAHARLFGAASVDELVEHHGRVLADVKRVFHESGVWAYPEERIGRMLRERGADPAIAPTLGALYVEERFRRLAPYPGALELLRRLRARGMRLGIVTNAPARQRLGIEGLGFLDAVDAVAIAGEEGVRKPDARLFEAALRRLGSPPPASVAVVGDSWEMDVAPARRLGMRAVYVAGAPGDARSRLFDQSEEPPPGLSADVVVARVTDIEPHLG